MPNKIALDVLLKHTQSATDLSMTPEISLAFLAVSRFHWIPPKDIFFRLLQYSFILRDSLGLTS